MNSDSRIIPGTAASMFEVWKVHDELLTLEKVKVRPGTPLEEWIPCLMGSGAVMYFLEETNGKKELVRVIELKIEELTSMLNSLGMCNGGA